MYTLIYEFPSKTKASQAYSAVRNLIHLHTCELSTYHMLIGSVAHLVVVGEQPSLTLAEPLKKAIKQCKGKETTLPQSMIDLFYQRHYEQTKHGAWTEHHYEGE